MVQLRRECDPFGTVIKNLRISEKAIEFDLYTNDPQSKEATVQMFQKNYGELLNERDLQNEAENSQSIIQPSQFLNKEDTVKLALDLFNQQRYWECHETLEQIWRRQEKGNEKDVQQGIILAASALVHHQRNENDVCLGMLPRALARLEKWPQETYLAFDISKLKAALERMKSTGAIALPQL